MREPCTVSWSKTPIEQRRAVIQAISATIKENADELHRLTDAMRHQRGVEARLHVREETPFYTGPRVSLSEWISRQPVFE